MTLVERFEEKFNSILYKELDGSTSFEGCTPEVVFEWVCEQIAEKDKEIEQLERFITINTDLDKARIKELESQLKAAEERIKNEPCTIFHPDLSSSSSTKCIHCGKEKYKHVN